MSDSLPGKMLRKAEGVAYWTTAAPVLARLPAALGYRLASRRGDFLFRSQADQRAEVSRNLRLVLGDELGPAEAEQLTRDWFRRASCEAVDIRRLRRDARALRRLVEIRGKEHLAAALAAGKGAILCTAHLGSYNAGFSVLHASGFPVTVIGRRDHVFDAELSALERRFWDLVHTRPVWRHRARPNIEPWPGRFKVAAQAAAALRANEVVTISIDAVPLSSDQARAVEVPFLGRQARLLPGVVTLAQVSGAPLLLGFLSRAADYQHQVWEISAPVSLEGEPAAVFERCASEVSAAIRRSPADWVVWDSTSDLTRLGML
jgi:phosphatidylinositol dimannoside acyltransferase